ncbi:conserved hypothetical protein [Flavobacterium sp. 9AF]|uniref:hypothetical protein n=1 Tax=Flavobacterium sp. 9AF TaxID=2653142 RepID=UPI0012F046C3|nr:hypothetical protein [Flavobacterium sp. 9AF]VXC01523.1 conserved hypothetical protein [Flavobacterium sp. 9AF]
MAGTNEQTNDTYTVNPNQIVYDQVHEMDFQVEVMTVYFAEKKPKMIWEAKTETYTVKNGGTPVDVKKKYEAENRRNITTDLADDVRLSPNQNVNVSWEEQIQEKDDQGQLKFEYNKLDKAKIKDKVFVVANCNGTNGKLTLEINENKLDNEELVYDNPIKFLIGEEEKTKIEFTINNTFIYAQEIILRPKSDEDLKKLVEKFEKREKKNAFLFFKANVTDTEDDIVYPDESQEFLNKDKEQFEIVGTPCYCNRDITVDEIIDLIYHLRDKQNHVTNRNKFFDSGTERITEISISTGKISDNRSKIELFINELNAMFRKFGITTCKRKIHFIGQMYLETASFRYTYENRTTVPSNYKGGVDFQGRGMKQITHDYNYLAYYDYINTTTLFQTYMTTRNGYESVGECVTNRIQANNAGLNATFYDGLKTFAKKISEELFHSFNSAGWFSTIYKPTTLAEMDKGLEDENVRLVTRAINGGENNLAERKDYTKWTKEFFKYDTECIKK